MIFLSGEQIGEKGKIKTIVHCHDYQTHQKEPKNKTKP